MKRRSLNLAITLLLGSGGAVLSQGAGWMPLFNGQDVDNFTKLGDANWRIEDGVLVADRGNGYLVSKESFGDFQLRAELWVDAETNSGIFIRATNPAEVTSANAYEVNLWDVRPDPSYGTGAIVDVAKVTTMPKAGGRWNVYEITAKGDSFTVVLNGETTVAGARDAKHATGRIALQHGAGLKGADGVVNDRGVVKFRKLEIKAI